MQYAILLKSKKSDETYWHTEALLPGIIISEQREAELKADYADDKLGLCTHCNLDCKPHPIAPDGSKYCTRLLWDVVRPRWRLSDLP